MTTVTEVPEESWQDAFGNQKRLNRRRLIMAKTHRSYRSTLRMAFFSTLLLGALTVLGMAILPEQFAHAAATHTSNIESLDPAKPKAKVVSCVADPRVDPLFEHCKRSISVGDIVSVTRWLPYEDGTVWKYCKYELKVDSAPFGHRCRGGRLWRSM